MRALERTLTLASSALRHSWVALVVTVALALGWLLRGGLAPVSEQDRTAPAEATAAAGGSERPAQMWTCAMHAQIQLPAPGSCPICGMDLTPLEQSAAGGLRQLSMSPAARALAQIRTAPVERRAVEAEVRMVGKIDYAETRLADITAWVGGRIDRLFVDYTGVEVNQGDHMVELYSPELYVAQEELLQALRALQEIERRGAGELEGMARSTLNAAREKLRLWGLKAEQVEELERRGESSSRVTIYAPTSGIVVHKSAQQGMYVETGTRIYTLADLSRLWVRLEAYEQDLPWLRYGQEVEFTTPARPGEVFRGTVAFIDPVLDARTRTVKVRVNVENPEGKLKPQMFVRAHVHAQVAAGGRVMAQSLAGRWICPMHPEIVKDGPAACDLCGMDLVTPESLGYVSEDAGDAPLPLVIPVSAALVTGKRAVVYVEIDGEDGPLFEGREIVLGPRAGDTYLVERGLTEGERVVVNGSFKIDSALQIQARPSMMLPEGGGSGTGAHDHGETGASERREPRQLGDLAGHVSPSMARSLARVESAYADVERAAELEPRRAAFARLVQAVDAVEVDSLEGEALALWRELAMKLGNDATVGAMSPEPADAGEALDGARRTLERLREAFGRHDPELLRGFVAPAAFRRQTSDVWRAYLALHAALAGDDPQGARGALRSMRGALDAVDASALERAPSERWEALRSSLESELAGAEQAADLEGLRVAFEPLSASLKAVVRAFGVDTGPVWELHCPMAFDFRGASWLQATEEVLNPYFGAEMLRCGSVLGAVGQPTPTQEERDHEH